jgi:hypothetical protein
MFRDEVVDEKSIGIAVSRLHRVTEIQKLLIEQLRVLETNDPAGFSLSSGIFLFRHRDSRAFSSG